MTGPHSIPHVAAAAAARWGDRIALVDEHGALTFEGLWIDARRAAAFFIEAGVNRGDRIAIWAPNSRAWISAAIGSQIAGAAIVPLNTRLKGVEAADILRRTRTKIIMTVRSFLGADYPAMIAPHPLPDLQSIVSIDDSAAFAANDANDPRIDAALSAIGADDVSDIMFTSGTTGAPKGALNTHAATVRLFRGWVDAVNLTAEDRCLIVNPFFHTFGYKAGWLACLIAGARMHPMAVFDAQAAFETIRRESVTFVPGPPTLYQSLLAERARTNEGVTTLRTAVTGAAVVPPTLIERMRDELGFATVLTGYGMTECGTISMCRAGDDIDRVSQTCGRAMPGIEIKCIDEAGVTIDSGQTGEICVRGFGVMKGYLDDPKATSETIDADGWLHTGDVGRLDAGGYLRITDRKKDMYISGGFNCYPAEIEKLLSAHPSIEAVAVVGVPDERLGEVGMAFVVLRPGASLDGAALIAWARDAMANYKAPRYVEVVSDLPKNAAGKVLKTELRVRPA